MSRLALVLTIVALLTPATAAAGVHLLGITPSVHRGGYVSLQVITYVTATCSVRVHHGTSRPLVDPALGPKQNHLLGALQWRWRMGTRAARGRWTVDVSCGRTGSLRTSFVVL
ncbi:MAG: hypothetical protein ACXVRJ_00590 [Gaiellaceae bacterium]